MANFVLLYSGGSMPETEAEQAAGVYADVLEYDMVTSNVTPERIGPRRSQTTSSPF